jgi:periplasmic protein TonB
MLGGFDPRLQELFVRRNRGGALAWGLFVLSVVGTSAWLAYPPQREEIVEVRLEPEIQDFAVEEQPEPEPEPEPPPPPNAKVEVVSKPKPQPKPKPPEKKITEAAKESGTEKTVQVGPGGGQPGGSGGGGNAPPKTVEPRPKPEPKPEPKLEPKPKPKPKPALDPTQPIDRPENATAPKQKSGSAPAYPKELRDEGITGKVVLKLHVHRDGTVRGAKILRKSNNATTEEHKARADELFVAAVVAAVKTWAFEPAKLDGQPITVWHTVTVPFTLTAG